MKCKAHTIHKKTRIRLYDYLSSQKPKKKKVDGREKRQYLNSSIKIPLRFTVTHHNYLSVIWICQAELLKVRTPNVNKIKKFPFLDYK